MSTSFMTIVSVSDKGTTTRDVTREEIDFENQKIKTQDTPALTRVCMDTGPDFYVRTKDYMDERKPRLRAFFSTGKPVSEVLDCLPVPYLSAKDRQIADFFAASTVTGTVVHRENLKPVHELTTLT